MGWNAERSRDRVQEHLKSMGQIEIEPLEREADLESLLSETKCRDIRGAHVYVPVSNFTSLASENSETEEYRRLIQALHIYQREVNRIVENTDGIEGVPVHFQGSKLHALLYRPYDDGELATRCVLLQLILRDFVKAVFNPAFPNFDNFSVSGGADFGNSIGTRNGTRGDRELLFLGAPANYAAKIVRSNGVLRITDRVHELLPESLQAIAYPVGSGDDYRLESVTSEELDDLLEEFDINWDPDASAERVVDDKKQFPLNSIEYSTANDLIKWDLLSAYKNKRVCAASLFADVSGFTAYVDSAKTKAERKSALRLFHAIRRELARVIKDDFGGLRVQYQGDRVQGLFHLPKNDVGQICERAVEAAIGLQSSFEHVIKDLLPEAKPLTLKVGLDYGITLVSRLGTRGSRDRICLGEAVERAAMCEEMAVGGEIALTDMVYEALPGHLQRLFEKDSNRGIYIARGLTADAVARARRAASLYDGSRSSPLYVATGKDSVTVSGRAVPEGRQVVPTRTHAP